MSINRWMDKEDVVHIYNGIRLSHKKNEIMPFATIWIDLEIIILSHISQTKTNIIWYHLYVESKTTWREKQQVSYHTSFQLDLRAEYHRKAVISSALDAPPHSGPTALARGMPVPRGLLLWRCWLHLLSVDDPFIRAQLQFSQDFWMKTEKGKTAKSKNKKKKIRRNMN